MTNEKKILINYISYIIVGIIICFIGITGVFADTTIDTADWINVTGIKFSQTGLFYTGNPTYNNDWLLNNYYVYSGTYVNNGADWNYVEFSYFEHSGGTFNPCNSTSKFTANFRLLFTAPYLVDQVTQVKWGNDNCAMTSRNNQSGLIELACGASPSTGQQTDIFVYYSDSIFQQNQGYVYISRDIDISCGLNTDAIINNDNANTQNIINNNNQNTQDIINNQNQNTQDMIDSQKVCTPTKKESTKRYSTAYYSNPDNNIFANVGNTSWGWAETNTIGSVNTMSGTVKIVWKKITSSTVYVNPQFRLYTNEITQTESTPLTDSGSIILENVNNSTIKIAFKAGIGNRYQWEIYSEDCVNGNQVLNDSINDLNSTLNDSSSIDISSLGDTVGWLPPGPIDSIINLPLNLLNNLLTALNGTCAPLHVPIPYLDNKYLDIPCISTIFNQIEGLPNFWTWVGAICSVMILYKYLIALYKYYDDLTTLKANFISDFGGAP